jgi:hypothetical protein
MPPVRVVPSLCERGGPITLRKIPLRWSHEAANWQPDEVVKCDTHRASCRSSRGCSATWTRRKPRHPTRAVRHSPSGMSIHARAPDDGQRPHRRRARETCPLFAPEPRVLVRQANSRVHSRLGEGGSGWERPDHSSLQVVRAGKTAAPTFAPTPALPRFRGRVASNKWGGESEHPPTAAWAILHVLVLRAICPALVIGCSSVPRNTTLPRNRGRAGVGASARAAVFPARMI